MNKSKNLGGAGDLRGLWKALLPFLRLCRARWPQLGLGALLMLTTLAAGVGLIALSGWFLTATGIAGLALAAGAAFTLDIYRPGAGIRAFALTRTVARYFERLVTHDATLRLLSDLRVWSFARALRMDAAQAGRLRSGDTLNRVTADIDALDGLYIQVLAPLAVGIVACFLGAAALSLLDWRLGLLLLAPLLAAGLLLPWLSLRAGAATGAAMVGQMAALRVGALDLLRALAELRSYGAVDATLTRLRGVEAAYQAGESRMARIQALGNAGGLLCFGVGLVVVSALALLLHEQGRLDGPLTAFAAFFALAIFEVVTPLPAAVQRLGRTGEAARRITQLVARRPSIQPPARPAPAPEGSMLAFENLGFAYQPDAPRVLDGFDLTLAPGEHLAVVGPSGLGKSTLLQLALRLWDPQEGRVTLGGRDLREIAPETLYKRIAYLPQSAELFAASVAENLRMADPEASDERLWEVLRLAQLEDAIRALPEGLESWIGEAGLRLSGGEARRLALARALLRDAPILLLDEPTSGLDGQTAERMLSALEVAMKGRSVILVSHDRAVLPYLDRIVDLGTLALGQARR